jgi:uncharacterized protein YjbI with pentapeptide repeats
MLTPVPNIEYPADLIGSPGDRPSPASLNRIDLMCEQRMSHAGTYDQNYLETRMPGFPDDLNYDYFNDTPKDQWASDFFSGGESFEILNMHPTMPVIKGQIPTVYGRAFVDHQVNDIVNFREIPTQLETVWFFPESELGVLIYRGTIEVTEDDGTDIKKILIANENRGDIPREISEYQKQLELRTNLEESYKYLLYTAPLIPEGMKCGFEQLQDDSNFPLELIAKANMEGFSETKKLEMEEDFKLRMEALRVQMAESGMPPEQIDARMKELLPPDDPVEPSPEAQKITDAMEKVIPGIMDDPDNLDLTKLNLKAMDDVKAEMDSMAEEKTKDARQQLLDQIENLKQQEPSAGSQQSIAMMEKILEEMDLPPRLPRIDVDEIIQQIRSQESEVDKQMLVMQSQGMALEDIKKMQESFDRDDTEKNTRDGLEKALDGYRIGAHYLVDARSPHEGKEGEIREKLLEKFRVHGKTSHGDYAFLDLSNLDLAGIDLSYSFLEFADLSGSNLSNANLSHAILANAKFKNTTMSNVNLTDCNLGSIHFIGSTFEDCDLTGSTLSKSIIENTQFSRCKMAEKTDMMFEAEFQHARFIDSDLRKNTFIDSDISHCRFTGSDLSESNFVNPIMEAVNFDGSDLSGVNFVNAKADDSKFTKAKMKNVRFVGECTLENTDFTGADVSESNLRDCQLQKAKFTDALLFKTDLSGANLKGANFDNARAVQAQFVKSDLTFASLHKIDLMEGSLQKAIISGAILTDSNLYSVSFTGCTVGETDFSGAYLEKTVFKDWRP